MQLALTGVAVLIVFKTIQDAGIILYTFHPTLMAIGVSIFAKKIRDRAGLNSFNKKK